MIQPQEAAGGEGPEHGSPLLYAQASRLNPLFKKLQSESIMARPISFLRAERGGSSSWCLVVTTGQQQRPEHGCSSYKFQLLTSNF